MTSPNEPPTETIISIWLCYKRLVQAHAHFASYEHYPKSVDATFRELLLMLEDHRREINEGRWEHGDKGEQERSRPPGFRGKNPAGSIPDTGPALSRKKTKANERKLCACGKNGSRRSLEKARQRITGNKADQDLPGFKVVDMCDRTFSPNTIFKRPSIENKPRPQGLVAKTKGRRVRVIDHIMRLRWLWIFVAASLTRLVLAGDKKKR